MPLLILGVLVIIAAVAIFKVNQWQAQKYVKLAQKAKVARDADDVKAESKAADSEDKKNQK